MDIELKAREQLTWIKDNWVEDWEEPYRHETKYAIEDIFKILDERKAQLDSKDKVIDLLANHIHNLVILNGKEIMSKEEIIREFENEAKRENNTL